MYVFYLYVFGFMFRNVISIFESESTRLCIWFYDLVFYGALIILFQFSFHALYPREVHLFTISPLNLANLH